MNPSINSYIFIERKRGISLGQKDFDKYFVTHK